MITRSCRGGALLALLVSFNTVDARAADADASAARAESAHGDLPPWSLRMGVASGAPIPGLHEQILAAEGYAGPRWALTFAVERRISAPFGLGVMGRYEFRSLNPDLPDGAMELGNNGPTYSEQSWIFAVDAPITFLLSHPARGRATELAFVPWVGAGAGKLELHHASTWRPGPAFGGEIRLLWHGGRVAGGFTAGAYSFRITDPSSLDAPPDLGMILVSAMGGFDVG